VRPGGVVSRPCIVGIRTDRADDPIQRAAGIGRDCGAGTTEERTLIAPIFIPLFLRLGIEPQSVLAAYRVADSPMNIFTPIMAYFPLIVVFAARCDRNSGIGTVIALMLPYFLIMTVVWIVFFILWYVLGIPMGTGAPA
jgi:aminobenzoyl-glutamate transport protein